MRCPKCGYISFDHIETCLKCKKDISDGTEVEGTTYHAASPSFLRVPEKKSSETEIEIETETETVEESGITFGGDDTFTEEEYDFSDPDLDSLVVGSEEDEGTISFGGTGSEDFLLETDDESDEEGSFEFDLDDDDGLEFSEAETGNTPALTLPDELEDITDLAPPEEFEALDPVALSPIAAKLSIDDEVDFGEDLGFDLDGLDLDLGLSDTEEISDAEVSLSLDDIDLSVEDITEEGGGLDELDDINMDLGIDALESPSPSSKEKSPESLDSLDGISLSLD